MQRNTSWRVGEAAREACKHASRGLDNNPVYGAPDGHSLARTQRLRVQTCRRPRLVVRIFSLTVHA